MNNVVNILALIGLNQENLLVSDECIESDSNIMIFAKIMKKCPTICPMCGSVNVLSKGIVSQTINNTTKRFQGKEIAVYLEKHKYRCVDCDSYFREEANFVSKDSVISNAVKREIIFDLQNIKTYKEIAYEHAVSLPTVIKIMDKIRFDVNTSLRVSICIDEFHFKVDKYNKFPAIISDGQSGEILDIVRSRKSAYLIDYFSSKNNIELNTPKVICTDLNETYRRVIKLIFPKALHIVDFFHVTKLFTSLVNTKRVKAMNNYSKNSHYYNFFKKNWSAFLVNPNKLDEKYPKGLCFAYKRFQASTLIHELSRIDQDLYEAYKIYKTFCDLMSDQKYSDTSEIEKNLEFIIYKASSSSDKDVRKLSETLLNRSEEIINAYSEKNSYKISNGVAEGNNNKVKTLLKVCYGCSNFYRLKKRVLYIENKK